MPRWWCFLFSSLAQIPANHGNHENPRKPRKSRDDIFENDPLIKTTLLQRSDSSSYRRAIGVREIDVLLLFRFSLCVFLAAAKDYDSSEAYAIPVLLVFSGRQLEHFRKKT